MFNTTNLFNKLTAQGINCTELMPLAKCTSIRIGGTASIVAFVKNAKELITSIKEAKNECVKYVVIGNGSNVFFADEGFEGLVIVTSYMKDFSIIGNVIKADCGALLSHVAIAARKESLSGLEFAYGIPGTVGGALFMNAGAYGGEFSDVVVSSICYDPDTDTIRKIDLDEHEFKYRESIYSKKPQLIILAVMMELIPGDINEITRKMNSNIKSRKEKQPLDLPSAGSVFKRPLGYYAGELIEKCGLKGYRIGGAEVSEKHAGFIVNRGDATASDVISLIDHIKSTVMENYGVELDCEVKYIKA